MNHNLNDLARDFAVLSDPTRLAIIQAITRNPRNVQALCKFLGLKQSTMSHHLAILRLGRFIKGRRDGPSVVYSPDRPNMDKLVLNLATLVSR